MSGELAEKEKWDERYCRRAQPRILNSWLSTYVAFWEKNLAAHFAYSSRMRRISLEGGSVYLRRK